MIEPTTRTARPRTPSLRLRMTYGVATKSIIFIMMATLLTMIVVIVTMVVQNISFRQLNVEDSNDVPNKDDLLYIHYLRHQPTRKEQTLLLYGDTTSIEENNVEIKVWSETASLTASSSSIIESIGPLRIGAHTSISSDGSTIAIGMSSALSSETSKGGNNDGRSRGLVQIFRRKNETVHQDQHKEDEAINVTTAAVAEPNQRSSNSTINDGWVQIGQDLYGDVGLENLGVNSHFGVSLSLSSDGNVIAIGGYKDNGANSVGSGFVKVFHFFPRPEEGAGSASNDGHLGTWVQIGDTLQEANDSNNDGDDSNSNLSKERLYARFGQGVSVTTKDIANIAEQEMQIVIVTTAKYKVYIYECQFHYANSNPYTNRDNTNPTQSQDNNNEWRLLGNPIDFSTGDPTDSMPVTIPSDYIQIVQQQNYREERPGKLVLAFHGQLGHWEQQQQQQQNHHFKFIDTYVFIYQYDPLSLQWKQYFQWTLQPNDSPFPSYNNNINNNYYNNYNSSYYWSMDNHQVDNNQSSNNTSSSAVPRQHKSTKIHLSSDGKQIAIGRQTPYTNLNDETSDDYNNNNITSINSSLMVQYDISIYTLEEESDEWVALGTQDIIHTFNISSFFPEREHLYHRHHAHNYHFDHLSLAPLTKTKNSSEVDDIILAVGTICTNENVENEDKFHGCVKLYQYQKGNTNIHNGTWVERGQPILADISGSVQYGGSVNLVKSQPGLLSSSISWNTTNSNATLVSQDHDVNGLALVIGEPFYDRGNGRIVVYQMQNPSSSTPTAVPSISPTSSAPILEQSDHDDSENDFSWIQYGNTIHGDYTYATASNDGSTIVMSSSKYYPHLPYVKAFRIVNDTKWVQIGQTIYGTVNHEFGCSIAISENGNVLAIGSSRWYYGYDIDEYTPGYVNIYTLKNDTWTISGSITEELDYIKRDPFIVSNYFGSSVSISNDGDRLAVASKDGVYLYERNGTNGWNDLGNEIEINASQELHGVQVNLAGKLERILIGSPLQRRAMMYQYQNNTSLWDEIGSFSRSDLPSFGEMLSISDQGDSITVGNRQFGEAHRLGDEGEWLQIKLEDEDPETLLTLRFDGKTITSLTNVTGRYIYAIEGLLVKYGTTKLDHVCTPNLRSRWEKVDSSDCDAWESEPLTNSMLSALLSNSKDSNPYIRDIIFPEFGVCSFDEEPELFVQDGDDCWKRVHDEHLSIFDVSKNNSIDNIQEIDQLILHYFWIR